jgi:hypothetical protein
MNERIRELAEQARIQYEQDGAKVQEPGQYYHEDVVSKFAELIVQEFSNLLWEESERLYEYSTECDDNSHESDEAELVAEKCVDLIKMVEEHFGVKE